MSHTAEGKHAWAAAPSFSFTFLSSQSRPGDCRQTPATRATLGSGAWVARTRGENRFCPAGAGGKPAWASFVGRPSLDIRLNPGVLRQVMRSPCTGVSFYRGQVCSLSVAQVNSAESCYLLQGLCATMEDGVSRRGSGFS